MFNGNLLRVISKQEKKDYTEIAVSSDTSYREIVGLRYIDGDKVTGLHARIDLQVLSAYVIVVSKDGVVFFINRDSGDWNHALEFPGGFIQAEYEYEDIKEFAIARASSDLHIDNLYITEVECIGFIDAKEIFEMVLIYKIQSALTFEEIKQRSEVEVLSIPEGYEVALHSKFFDKKIYPIMQNTLEVFLLTNQLSKKNKI